MPKTFKLALWGPPQAGKTVYLAQLYWRQSTQPEWAVRPGISPDDDPKNPPMDVFIDNAKRTLLANKFPEPTMAGTSGSSVRYHFQHKTDGHRQATLYANDRAGKDWLDLDDISKQELSSADGVLLLFDTDEGLPKLEEYVERTLKELRRITHPESGTDGRPFAICLSKADTRVRTTEDLRYAERHPREFVRSKISKELETWVELYCGNAEYFPVSSVGVKFRHGCVEPLWLFDEALTARICTRANPINLMMPFDWLFRQLEEREAADGARA